MKLDNLVAIDTHVHIEPEPTGNAAEEAARKYFGNAGVSYGRKELAEYYRSRKIGCVVFSVDERLTGRPQVSNDEVVDFAAENSDIVMAFASVDPMRGPEAVKEARRLIAKGGIRGFKLHPPLQQFHANDKAAYPFYEVIAEAKLPVIFHTGHSGIGTGMPGGGGVRLKYGNPMDIDDVAVDFPDMPIIMAHPSFPWQDEAISVCLHKPQVYIDLSGWSPKYFSPILIQYANTLLKKKMLFGSDYPLITPDRWMTDFAAIAIRDEVRPLILKENAARLFSANARCVPRTHACCVHRGTAADAHSTACLAPQPLGPIMALDLSAQAPHRARDLHVPFDGNPGPLNAITDVPGIAVGHTTLISGDGKLQQGTGPIRTGVTAIMPRGVNNPAPVFAGYYSQNGNGEMTGTAWIEESGFAEGPIAITNTHSVGLVRDTVIKWQVNEAAKGRRTMPLWSLPIVAETWDGFLNDINGFHVHEQDVFAALNGAKSGPVPEGAVGGGTGMICYGFKGGIGTSSRKLADAAGGYTVGVLVQCNCGRRPQLLIAGVPVGKEIAGQVHTG